LGAQFGKQVTAPQDPLDRLTRLERSVPPQRARRQERRETRQRGSRPRTVTFKVLPLSDRIALTGALLAAATSILPWKQTAEEGEVVGLLSLGFPFFLGALCCAGALFIRVRSAGPHLHPVIPWLAQLGAACFCVLWCFVFIKLSSNAARVSDLGFNVSIPISRPVFGVYLGLFTGVITLTGTLLGLREKPS